MKTVKKLILAFALPLLAGATLVSCEDDNDTVSKKPTIVLDNEGGFIAADTAVNPNVALNFRIVAQQNASTKKKINNLTITRVFNNNPEVVLDSNMNESSINLEFSIAANAAAGTENFIFTVTDKDGFQDKKTVAITTIGLEVRNGDIRHIAGPNGCLGSFDLINVLGLTSGADDANKDMVNTDQAGAAFTGSFTARNATRFVVGNAINTANFNYDNATEAQIQTAYSLGQATATVNNPANATGGLIFVNLRGLNRYAVIRVTEVNVDDKSCNANANNKGKFSFEYKIANDVVLN